MRKIILVLLAIGLMSTTYANYYSKLDNNNSISTVSDTTDKDILDDNELSYSDTLFTVELSGDIDIDIDEFDELFEVLGSLGDIIDSVGYLISGSLSEMDLEELNNLNVYVYDNEDDYEVKDVIHKNFSVSPNAKLKIDNKFGDVVVHVWDKPQIDIEVFIICTARSEKSVHNLRKNIDVDFSSSSTQVTAITEINSRYSRFNKDNGFEINYFVKVPADVNMILENQFGDIAVDNVNSDIDVLIEYGEFRANSLKGNGSVVNARYGQVRIEEAKNLNISVQYCDDCEIEKVEKMIMNAKYSNFDFDSISIAQIGLGYSDLRVDYAKQLEVIAEFSDIKVGELAWFFSVNRCNFGSIRINEVGKGFSKIDINAEFSPVKISLSEGQSFDAELRNSHGSIKFTNDYPNVVRTGKVSDFIDDDDDKFDETFYGKVGNPIPGGNKVKIINSNANITIGD